MDSCYMIDTRYKVNPIEESYADCHDLFNV